MAMPTTPWGLTRLEPFATVTFVPAYTIELDHDTQTGSCRFEDGSLVTFRHRKSNRATETATQLNSGDGASPRSNDPDSDQDSEED